MVQPGSGQPHNQEHVYRGRPISDTRICLPRRSTHNGTGWRDHAAYRDIDPELFFPIGNADPALLQTHRKGQTGVRRLPGTHAMPEVALESGQEAGVRGGTRTSFAGLVVTRDAPIVDRALRFERRTVS